MSFLACVAGAEVIQDARCWETREEGGLRNKREVLAPLAFPNPARPIQDITQAPATQGEGEGTGGEGSNTTVPTQRCYKHVTWC